MRCRGNQHLKKTAEVIPCRLDFFVNSLFILFSVFHVVSECHQQLRFVQVKIKLMCSKDTIHWVLFSLATEREIFYYINLVFKSKTLCVLVISEFSVVLY